MKTSLKQAATFALISSVFVAPMHAQLPGAVGGVANQAPTPAVRQPMPAPSVPTAAATAGAESAARAQAATGAASSAANAATHHSAGVQAGRPLQDGAAVSAGGDVSAAVDARSRNVSTSNATQVGVSASLNSAETLSQVRAATRDTRDHVFTEVNARIEAGARKLNELRQTGRRLEGAARDKFDAAWNDVRAKEKAAKASLKEARKAKDETWAEAQAKLASDYEAYATAAAEAEAMAQGNTQVETKSPRS
jgi:hypothetical protein